MAHHVGMSLLAADNLLTGQKMQRRFMSDGFMSGASGLFEEKIPADVRAFKDIRSAEVSKPRERVRERSVISPCPDPTRPRTALYTNGRLTCCISDIGTSSAHLTDMTLTQPTATRLGGHRRFCRVYR